MTAAAQRIAPAPLLIELGWPAQQLSPNARKWTDKELAIVIAAYCGAECGEDIGLDALAQQLGRHKSNISRKARSLGLTDISRPLKRTRKARIPKIGREGSEELRAHQSVLAKERIAKNGHPRGFLGKKHKAEALRAISEKSKSFWASLTAEEYQQLCDKLHRSQTGAPKVARGTWKAAWREIGGKRNFYRSRWEANYARWLQWLKERGEIAEWEHEPQVFWFDKIKRGVRSYKPDFRVTENGGNVSWHEVKGWMDARSRTTLRRFAKYYPDEILILIAERQINSLRKNVSALIEGWE